MPAENQILPSPLALEYAPPRRFSRVRRWIGPGSVGFFVLVAILAASCAWGGWKWRLQSDRKAFEAQSLIGRIGDPEDIKGLALYLASPCSSYVTGGQFVIDGGSLNRIK